MQQQSERHKCVIFSSTGIVNSLCEQFLAGSGFASDEHCRRAGGSGNHCPFLELFHDCAFTHNIFEGGATLMNTTQESHRRGC